MEGWLSEKVTIRGGGGVGGCSGKISWSSTVGYEFCGASSCGAGVYCCEQALQDKHLMSMQVVMEKMRERMIIDDVGISHLKKETHVRGLEGRMCERKVEFIGILENRSKFLKLGTWSIEAKELLLK